ncbi:MAG: transglutaminase family protein [Methanobacteriaceae archaeon]|nr:transglutaminase family protein [Methanobacteriaceae archaeon]
MLLFLALLLPIDDVNAADQQITVNQSSNLNSNLTRSNSTINNSQNTTVKTNTTTKSVSTKFSTVYDNVPYTYYEKVPYKVKAKVVYYKPYWVKARVTVKKWYYSRGKYRAKYAYSYKYIKKYRKAYKWGYVTKYKSVAKTGYIYTSDYLKNTKNANASDPTIQTLAKKLTNGTNSTHDKALNIFNWVRDNLSYSFYYNTRYGAVKTLKNKAGNCVDHSHLMVALARAASIPARYAHGTCKFTSGNTYGHVWVQLFINDTWISADASSSRNSLGSIKSWNTETVYMKGIYKELLF